jgi:hypothetical protein
MMCRFRHCCTKNKPECTWSVRASSDHEFVKLRNQAAVRGYLSQEEGPRPRDQPITIEEAMRIRLMIASAATAALLAGAAYAQNAPAGDTAVNPPSANQLPAGAAPDAAPAPIQGSSGASAPGVASPSSDAATVAPAAGAPTQRAPAASAGTDVISNGPIPDTKENRAKYGQPLSHAGKMTKAAGN